MGRKGLTLLISVLVLASGAVQGAGARTLAEPGPGYFSENVEWITTVPIHTDSPGAKVLGKYMYISTERDLTIYDLSDPTAPVRVGFLPYLPPQEYYYPEEDVDTNGKILIRGGPPLLDSLYIVDVEDKTNPTQIGVLEGVDEHTWTCVMSCRYAYGSEGSIVDLRNPTKPKLLGSWVKKGGVKVSSTHDVTEVAPGYVVTSTRPFVLLDARKPASPKALAVGNAKEFIHSNIWPRRMKDRFLLVGGESSGPSCDSDTSGSFMTWDATKWRRTGQFKMLDQWKVTNGLPTDGDALANTYCTHWFDDHPRFRNGGLVAMSWYESGTRFFRVDGKGKIKDAGYFLPLATSASAAYWVTDRIVYILDYQRGLDIVRYTGKL
jgi:LVIVD repeat